MITLFQCLYLVLFSFICYQGAAALSHSTAVSWLTAVLGAAVQDCTFGKRSGCGNTVPQGFVHGLP